MKRSRAFSAALIVILIAAFLALRSAPLVSIFEQQLILLASEQGLGLRFSSFRPYFFGARADQLWLVPQRSFVAFEVKQPDFSLSLLSVLKLQPSIEIVGKLYQGDLNALVNPKLSGIRMDFDLKNLALTEHPQLAALELSSGELNLSAQNFLYSRDNFPSGTFNLTLLDLSKTESTVIPQFLTNGLTLSIPAIKALDLRAMIELADNQVNVSELQIKSLEHGSLRGNMKLGIANRRISSVDGEFELELTAESRALFALLRGMYGKTISSPGNSQAPDEILNWNVSVAGKLPPQIEYIPR